MNWLKNGLIARATDSAMNAHVMGNYSNQEDAVKDALQNLHILSSSNYAIIVEETELVRLATIAAYIAANKMHAQLNGSNIERVAEDAHEILRRCSQKDLRNCQLIYSNLRRQVLKVKQEVYKAASEAAATIINGNKK